MDVKAKDLTKKYGDKVAVSDISIKMRKGQTVGLLGPNGSGKSTTIKMLTGQINPTAGEIKFDEVDIKQIGHEINSLIGIMPQEIIIWDHLTVVENLNYSGKLYGLSTKKLKERTDFLLKKLHLESEANTVAKKLSGGYKRRLHLAISIVHDPKVIFLDEPTPGIDPQSRRALWDFVDELKQSGEYSILLTDHYLDEAEKVCDYIIIIDEGKLVTEGNMKELKKEHGNGKFITIDLVKSNDLFIKAILSKFDKAVVHNEKVSIPTGKPEKDIPVLLQHTQEYKVEFDDISIKEPSLEDIFLLLTGKEVRK